jgi:hypothetical protein
MPKPDDDKDPEVALRDVLHALTSYTCEQRLPTYSALMTAIVRYGRACRRDEAARIFADLADVRRTAALAGPERLEAAIKDEGRRFASMLEVEG